MSENSNRRKSPRQQKLAHDQVNQQLSEIYGLKGEADHLRNTIQLVEALACLNLALKAFDETPEIRDSCANKELHIDLLDARSECQRYLGHYQAAVDDLSSITVLAESAEDASKKVNALIRQAELLALMGEVQAIPAAENALALAREMKDPNQICAGLVTLGDALIRISDYSRAPAPLEDAIALAEKENNPKGQAQAHLYYGSFLFRLGKMAEAKIELDNSLSLFRRIGDREGQGHALNMLGNIAMSTNITQGLHFYEASLAAFESIGFRFPAPFNNLGNVYAGLGLYNRAVQTYARGIELASEMQMQAALSMSLGNIAAIYLELGELEAAKKAFIEALDIAETTESWELIATALSGLATVALAEFQLEKSKEQFEKSLEMLSAEESPDESAINALLGGIALLQGDQLGADKFVQRANDILAVRGSPPTYLLQELYWWFYRIKGDWSDLERAWQSIAGHLTNMSDAGLRRSALHHVSVHRLIVREWLRQAINRGLPLDPLTDQLKRPGSLSDQFQRLLEIGVRLNSQMEAGKLPEFIMQELVEFNWSRKCSPRVARCERRISNGGCAFTSTCTPLFLSQIKF